MEIWIYIYVHFYKLHYHLHVMGILDIPDSKSSRILQSVRKENHEKNGGERLIKLVTNNCSDFTLLLLVTKISSLLINK